MAAAIPSVFYDRALSRRGQSVHADGVLQLVRRCRSGRLPHVLVRTSTASSTPLLSGAWCRRAIARGDPDGSSLHSDVIARCRTTIELLAPRASTPGLQIRTHQATLYSSIFRVDDHIIVNFHIYGSPGRNNPVMMFTRSDDPRLWATFEHAFNRVWDNAKPLTDRGHPFP